MSPPPPPPPLASLPINPIPRPAPRCCCCCCWCCCIGNCAGPPIIRPLPLLPMLLLRPSCCMSRWCWWLRLLLLMMLLLLLVLLAPGPRWPPKPAPAMDNLLCRPCRPWEDEGPCLMLLPAPPPMWPPACVCACMCLCVCVCAYVYCVCVCECPQVRADYYKDLIRTQMEIRLQCCSSFNRRAWQKHMLYDEISTAPDRHLGREGAMFKSFEIIIRFTCITRYGMCTQFSAMVWNLNILGGSCYFCKPSLEGD